MKKLTALLLSIGMVLLLSGCGDKNPEGTYILSSMESMGIEMNYADLELIGGMEASIEFKKNGDVEMSVDGESAICNVDLEEGTIEVEGDLMNIKVNEDQIEISGEDEEIEIKMIFTEEDSSKWKEIKKEESNYSE